MKRATISFMKVTKVAVLSIFFPCGGDFGMLAFILLLKNFIRFCNLQEHR